MTVSFQLAPKLEDQLKKELCDVNLAAKEAFLVALFRQQKLSHRELAEALGLDRFQTDSLLKASGVTEHLASLDELQVDLHTLESLLGPAR